MPAEGALRRGGPMDISLIETLRWEPDTGFVRLERHLARLARSAEALGLPGAEKARDALFAVLPPSALPGISSTRGERARQCSSTPQSPPQSSCPFRRSADARARSSSRPRSRPGRRVRPAPPPIAQPPPPPTAARRPAPLSPSPRAAASRECRRAPCHTPTARRTADGSGSSSCAKPPLRQAGTRFNRVPQR